MSFTVSVLQLFDAARAKGNPLYVAAPMVRYSKLPFRLLARHYHVDILHTPMILAHEFIRSPIARDSDFTTNPHEQTPSPDLNYQYSPLHPALVAQFASSSPVELARAASLIGPWVSGIDLNCGCPQSWALKEGIGCSLMQSPQLVARMVRAAKSRLAPHQTVSVKIRLHADLAETLRWVQLVETEGGVDYITIHGRTRSQRSSTAPDFAAIKFLRQHLRVPVVANGDAYSQADVHAIAKQTGADGVMAARGLLENPALFAGFDATPVECVRRFMEYAVRSPMPFPLVLHHVGEMVAGMRNGESGIRKGLGKEERRRLMASVDLVDLVDFVDERWGL